MKELPNQIYRLQQVQEIVGLKKTAIFRLMSENKFPRPIALTERARGWVRSDIEAWLNDRIAASRAAS